MRRLPLLGILLLACFQLVFLLSPAFCDEKTPLELIVPGRYHMLEWNHDSTYAANASNLFVWREGTLLKLDPRTFEQKGLFVVFGPAPKVPAGGFATYQEGMEYVNSCALRLLPATVLASDKEVQIVMGDVYLRIDPATMTLKLAAQLLEDQKQLLQRVDSKLWGGTTALASNATTLFRLLSPWPPDHAKGLSLEVIDRNTGKIVATKELGADLTAWKGLLPIASDTGFPNAMNNVQRPSLLMKTYQDSLFVLSNGVLVKYDARTYAEKQRLTLFDDLPVLKDADKASDDEKMAVNIDRMQRLVSPSLFLMDNNFVILIGDHFFQVDPITMTRKIHNQVVKVDDDLAQSHLDALFLDTPAQTFLLGKTLYHIHGQQILAIDTMTGKPLIMKPLPAELLDQAALNTMPIVQPGVGSPLFLRGILEKHTGDKGDFWTVGNDTQGEYVVTGDKLAPALALMKAPDWAVVMAFGTLKAANEGEVQYGKGTVNVDTLVEMPAGFPITGKLVKHEGDGQHAAVWTVKSANSEYTLAGEQLAKLTAKVEAKPKLLERELTITGSFKKTMPEQQAIGRGFIEIKSFQFAIPAAEITLPSPALAVVARDEGIYLLRKGVLAKLDPQTLEAKGTLRLMLPPAPSKADATPAERVKYAGDMAPFTQPSNLYLAEKSVVANLGNAVIYNIDPAALVTRQTIPIPTISADAQKINLYGTSTTQQVGSNLCLTRNGHLLLLKLNGEMKWTDSILPASMTATFFPMPGQK